MRALLTKSSKLLVRLGCRLPAVNKTRFQSFLSPLSSCNLQQSLCYTATTIGSTCNYNNEHRQSKVTPEPSVLERPLNLLVVR